MLIQRSVLLVVCSFLLFITQGVHAENFPLPKSLVPNVEFWKRVYSEIDTGQGFLHDARYLNIVYETLKIPKKASRKQRKRITNRAREKYRKILLAIAGKPVSSLSGAQLRVRRLFPANTTSQQIKAASRRIRFQLGQADKFKAAIERSGLITHHIERKLAEANMPLELAALPYVESSFNLNARSHVGAAGMWQFMPSTGRRFMKVNHVIDERYDPFRASDAAVRLLQYNYSILKSWPLALTAYNHGVGGMRRAVKRLGTTDIGVIARKYKSRSFGFASRNFYAEFLAALEVSQHYSKYFGHIRKKSPISYTHFRLPDFVSAKSLAKALSVKESVLQKHNPALRKPVWSGDKRVPSHYDLRVPAGLLTASAEYLIDRIPASDRYKEQVRDKTYRVQRGDSLSRIAALYGVKVSDLVAMNNLRSRHRIRAGQTLYLPQKGKVSVAALSADVKKKKLVKQKPIKAVKPAEPVTVASAEPVTIIKSKPRVEPIVNGDEGASETISQKDIAEKEIVEPEEQVIDALEGVVEKVQPESVENEQVTATDPSDYQVDADESIEIQAAETLGHYADWLEIKTNRLRILNKISRWKPLVIGRRIRLDFSKVSSEEFVQRRLQYHKELEDEFFALNRIAGTRSYSIRRGDSLWIIANKRFSIPLWLIRQYNPDVDFSL
ncbi:MAG: LysM peptidoglycan-binding domain-containing protein, partial [Gammaproteobacteria bacterium]